LSGAQISSIRQHPVIEFDGGNHRDRLVRGARRQDSLVTAG